MLEIILPIVGGVLLIGAVIAVILIIKRKPKGPNVNDAFIDELVGYYGGIGNIKSVDTENSRLKIEVNDLDQVNLDKIKENAQNGVFVTGSIIKTLYRLDSVTIKKMIDGRK